MARKKFQWSRDEENPEGETFYTERESWADRDRANQQIVALAKVLVGLSPSLLGELTLGPGVADAVADARRLKQRGNVKGGLRRQMLLVATRLREEDEEKISELMDDLSQRTGFSP